MKKAGCFFLVFSLLLCGNAAAETAAPSNSAEAAVLLHADTGEVLYEKNADARLLIASTTKIMTALVVLENCDETEFVTVTPDCVGVEGSSAYLQAGECYTVSDLLCGLLLASGNDAATALALYVGGSIEGFAEKMNAKAAELGLENSHFVNPHGLDAEGHYSSARDLAKIAAAAMRIPLFASLVSTKCAAVGENTYYNHNRLLSLYEGAIGIKTGYTMAAGRSLVSCAERNGLCLICVTLNDGNDWNDHCALLDWGFSQVRYQNVVPSGTYAKLPVISGEKEVVRLRAAGTVFALLAKGETAELYAELPRFVYAPIAAGETAGRLRVFRNGEEVGSVALVYQESVSLRAGLALSPWERFQRILYQAGRYGALGSYDGLKL